MKAMCNKLGCNNHAKYEVRLSISVDPIHRPAISDPLVIVCEDHKNVEWKDVVTDEGWERIKKGFISQGYQTPDKRYSSVMVVPITTLN